MTDAAPPVVGDQREMLIAFNDLQRRNLLWKLEGLSEEQLRRKHEPSGMCLLGLLKHLTLVEQTWFVGRMLGEPVDGQPNTSDAWNPTPEETYEVLAEQYREAWARSNAIATLLPLEQMTAVAGGYGMVSLQWILFHMLEETARHLGHADLIREAIDGATGVSAAHEARRRANSIQPDNQ